jgi:myosin protein heavy chain
MAAQLDSESSSKANHEKMSKQYELQMIELQSKVDEQSRQLQDFTSLKGRIHNENSDLGRQLEEAEAQVSALSRLKSQLTRSVEKKIFYDRPKKITTFV